MADKAKGDGSITKYIPNMKFVIGFAILLVAALFFGLDSKIKQFFESDEEKIAREARERKQADEDKAAVAAARAAKP